MNYISVITGLIVAIMALTSKRIKFIVQVLLSSITTYWIFNKWRKITLWSDSDYTTESIYQFFKSGLCLELFLCTLSVWLFFYCMLRITIEKMSIRIFRNVWKQYLEKIPILLFNKIVGIVLIKVLLKIFGKGFFEKNQGDVWENKSLHNTEDFFYSVFCFVGHLIIILIMFEIFNITAIILLSITIFISIVMILTYPFVNKFKNTVSNSVNLLLK